VAASVAQRQGMVKAVPDKWQPMAKTLAGKHDVKNLSFTFATAVFQFIAL